MKIKLKAALTRYYYQKLKKQQCKPKFKLTYKIKKQNIYILYIPPVFSNSLTSAEDFVSISSEVFSTGLISSLSVFAFSTASVASSSLGADFSAPSFNA